VTESPAIDLPISGKRLWEKMKSIRVHIAMLAFVMILGASYSARAAGFDITEFYTGKAISFIVGSENTSYARTIGRHMMK